MGNWNLLPLIPGIALLVLSLAGCNRSGVSLVVQSETTAPIIESSIPQAPLTLSVNNAKQITETARLQGHQEEINVINFSPDGTMLASGDVSSSILLWDVQQKKELTRLEGPTGHVADMVFHPDGTTIIAMTTNWSTEADFHKLRLWNVKTYAEAPAPAKIGQTKTEDVRSASAIEISPDGKQLAMNTCSGSVSMSNTGDILCDSNGVRLLDIHSGDSVTELPQTFEATVREMAFSPDGTLLAAVGGDGTARLFNLKDATEKRLLLRSETHQALSITFSADGKIVAVGLGDGTVHLIDAKTGNELQKLQGHTEPVISLAFSPDGTLLASAGIDKTIRLWNVATGEPVTILQGHSDYVMSVAFSPDGTRIASGSYDKTVRFWGLPD